MNTTDNDTFESREWTLLDYWNVVLRRKGLMLITFVAVFAATVIWVWTRPPKFESSATFIIDSTDSGMAGMFGGGRNAMFNQQTRPLEFYEALIKSQAYMDLSLKAARQDSVIRRTGMTNEMLYTEFRNRVQLITSAKSELVQLAYKSTDPDLAWRVASIATDAFRARCRQVELEETRNVVDFVEDQKSIAKDKLQSTERTIQEFRSAGGTVITTEEGGLLQRLMELQTQLTNVQAQREMSEANLADFDQRLRELKVPDQSDMMAIDNPAVQQLRVELDRLLEEKTGLLASGAAPQTQLSSLDKRINEKREAYLQQALANKRTQESGSVMDQSLLDQIRKSRIEEELNLYMAKNRERYYQSLLDKYRRENPRLVERAIEEARLKSDKEVFSNLYNILLEKGEEARIKSATGTGGIKIIDEPTRPDRPVPSNSARNLAVGFILGLGLGFGLALMLEMLDHSIKNQDDVQRLLGVPLMGAVPHIKHVPGTLASVQRKMGSQAPGERRRSQRPGEDNTNGYHDQLLSSLRPRDPIVDTYRTLRTNLQFASVDKPIKSLLITSSLPGEGKTLSSANIAISYAELGHRVVLVDGDMRKPRQHMIFNINKSPGLSDYLIKGGEIDTISFDTHIPNLKLIPCGTIPPNPAEMIASNRMTDLIRSLEEKFDLVVVDSPPLNVVSDPVLFAPKVSHVLVVIKFAETNVRLVSEALHALSRSRAPLLGAVLNGIKLSRGYGYYGRYSYDYYAESGDKKKR